MNAQFGLVNVWLQGDAVTRSVLLLLLAMSLSSWLVIVLKLLDWRTFRRRRGARRTGLRTLTRHPRMRRAMRPTTCSKHWPAPGSRRANSTTSVKPVAPWI